MDSIESFMWGHDSGYKYRRFNQLRVGYSIIQSYRAVTVLLLSFWAFWDLYFDAYELIHNIATFANWGLFITIWALLFSFIATKKHYNDQSRVTGCELFIWRSALLWFETALVFETATFVSSLAFQLFGDNKYAGMSFLRILCIQYLPLPILLWDFYMQKWLFRSQHVIPLISIVIVYGWVNYFVTIYSGIPVYPTFLEWNPVWFSMVISTPVVIWIYYLFRFYKSVTEKFYSSNNNMKKGAMHSNEFEFDRDGFEFAKLDEKELPTDPKEKDI